MNIKGNHVAVLTACSVVCLLLLLPDDAIARAGGGSSKGGGILGLILAPFFIIYSVIVTYFAVKKNRECKSLLQIISSKDPVWEHDNLKRSIETAYFKIQEAWRERNQDIAKDFMSESLYAKHKIQTDDMIRKGLKNEMHNINLKEAKVVDVLDYADNTKDGFWALIHGSMVDYTILEKTGEIVDGEKKNNSFKELWRFKRESDKWVLDEIDQDVTVSDIREFSPFSEEI